MRQEGFVLPTVDYQHEYVIHWLETDIATVEDQGWARISTSGWQCLYRLSIHQKRALKARGYEVDKEAERLKRPWHGLPPYDETVPKAKRIEACFGTSMSDFPRIPDYIRLCFQ